MPHWQAIPIMSTLVPPNHWQVLRNCLIRSVCTKYCIVTRNTEKQEEHQAKKAELYKGVDATYFGFKDDDDGALAQVEQETEQRIMQEQAQHSKASTNSHAVLLQQAYIHVPSNEQVQNYLLEKRKREMLKNLTKYVQIQV